MWANINGISGSLLFFQRAHPIPSAAPYLKKLGQPHAIGITSLMECWANSKPTVAQLKATVGHSGGHWQWLVQRPTPCDWQCLVLGQFHAIGSTWMWANINGIGGSLLFFQRAHPIPLAAPYLKKLGQPHAIGITSLMERWANSKPMVAQLEATVGHSGGHWQWLVQRPTPCDRQCLILGQFCAIGSMWRWANINGIGGSLLFCQRAHPIPLAAPYLKKLGQPHAIRITSLMGR